MPLFCCYSDVELAANEMQVEAHEKPQFRLKMVNLGEENPRKWYQSSVRILFRPIKLSNII